MRENNNTSVCVWARNPLHKTSWRKSKKQTAPKGRMTVCGGDLRAFVLKRKAAAASERSEERQAQSTRAQCATKSGGAAANSIGNVGRSSDLARIEFAVPRRQTAAVVALRHHAWGQAPMRARLIPSRGLPPRRQGLQAPGLGQWRVSCRAQAHAPRTQARSLMCTHLLLL